MRRLVLIAGAEQTGGRFPHGQDVITSVASKPRLIGFMLNQRAIDAGAYEPLTRARVTARQSTQNGGPTSIPARAGVLRASRLTYVVALVVVAVVVVVVLVVVVAVAVVADLE